MPRRNNRKDYSTGKPAVFFENGGNVEFSPKCVGCAFAGYGGSCTTSDGTCLITTTVRKEPDGNAVCK